MRRTPLVQSVQLDPTIRRIQERNTLNQQTQINNQQTLSNHLFWNDHSKEQSEHSKQALQVTTEGTISLPAQNRNNNSSLFLKSRENISNSVPFSTLEANSDQSNSLSAQNSCSSVDYVSSTTQQNIPSNTAEITPGTLDRDLLEEKILEEKKENSIDSDDYDEFFNDMPVFFHHS